MRLRLCFTKIGTVITVGKKRDFIKMKKKYNAEKIKDKICKIVKIKKKNAAREEISFRLRTTHPIKNSANCLTRVQTHVQTNPRNVRKYKNDGMLELCRCRKGAKK